MLVTGVAYGTVVAVLAVHLDRVGIPKVAMGGLAACFAVGVITCSIPAGQLVQRFGAKRVLWGSFLGYAVCVASLPLFHDVLPLSAARFFDGAFSAGVWVSAETALLGRAKPKHRAFVMSLYGISLAVGYLVGALVSFLLVARIGTGALFVLAGGLALGSFVTVLALLDAKGGVHVEEAAEGASSESHPRSSPLAILRKTRTSCFGTFAYGYFQSAVVLFLPLFLMESKGVAREHTTIIPGVFAAGMLSMSVWVSRLGDRHGHLFVMRVLALIGGAMTASFVLLPSFLLMCGAVFVAGATLASISPVSLALQGAVVPKADLGRANAFYNAAYAAGMLLGPPVSGWVFTHSGGAAMLLHLAGLWTAFVVFTIACAHDDPRAAKSRAKQDDADEPRAMVG